MSEPLARFLELSRCKPWSWRDNNCGLWVADWVLLASGRDPALALRGAADSAEGWSARLDEGRDFLRVCREAMHGFLQTQNPKRGDVAVIDVPVHYDAMPGNVAVAAICVGPATVAQPLPLFCVRSLRGLRYQRFPVVLAWSL